LGDSWTRDGDCKLQDIHLKEVILILSTYTAKYVKINSGYMGQLIEWPEVISEGKTIEECREMIQDALHEMIIAYKIQNKEIPQGKVIIRNQKNGYHLF